MAEILEAIIINCLLVMLSTIAGRVIYVVVNYGSSETFSAKV